MHAQVLKGVITGEKAAELKGKAITVIVGSEDAKLAFEQALADCWSFTTIEEIIVNPNHKSKDEESGKYYMKLRESKSESLPSYSHSKSTTYNQAPNSNTVDRVVTDNVTKYSYVSVGYDLIISKGGLKTSLAEIPIPLDEIEDLRDDMIYYGLSTLQEQLDYLITSGDKNTMAFISDKYKNNNPSLKKKTLLVLENQLEIGKKETKEDVLKYYTASKISAVQYNEWNEAIVNKKEDFAYLIIVPIPVGGSYVLRYYIIDCANGKILAAYQPSAAAGMKGSNVKVDAGAKVLEKLGSQ